MEGLAFSGLQSCTRYRLSAFSLNSLFRFVSARQQFVQILHEPLDDFVGHVSAGAFVFCSTTFLGGGPDHIAVRGHQSDCHLPFVRGFIPPYASLARTPAPSLDITA